MDEKQKIKGMRRFMVFTQPHAWLNPVVELDDSTSPPTPIEYTDSRVLEQVILDLSRALARASGFNAGAADVLKTFGLTHDDYFTRKKANKEAKKSIDNPPSPTVESLNGQ